MSYREKPQLKLYKYENSAFVLQAIIDDYQEVSFERNLYQAGIFTITINYNITNALLFERGLFIQFGNDKYDFGEIYSIQDSIGEDGKGSQIRTITGYDARYILKRRVIKNMNSNGLWVMTAKGELCLRNLIKDQCGSGAEIKRQLPITNVIPETENAIGKVYSVSEQFTNLYEVCKTIATQSEIGWRLAFDGEGLTLECYEGENRSEEVRFDTSYESLANGEFSDSSESFSNAIYVGGKGQNDDRDIYEGENGTPGGLDRFESWDNQSSLTVESEYEAEAVSMLTQYGQTIQMSGNGLAKCPYIYKEQYNVGDWITVAFSGKSAVVQILSVTEHWAWGAYDLEFSFGKPQNNLAEQLQLMLRKIQSASNKTNSTDSVRWYTIPTDTAMPKADVTYNTIGFIGECASGGSTFQLYLDDEKTGAKTYHVYFKQLAGGNLTLTTGKAGAVDLICNSGTYVAIIYVDEDGNITTQGTTVIDAVTSGNHQAVSSDGVYNAIQNISGGNAYCETAGNNPAKTATMTGYVLQNGNTFQITFKNANSSQTALTLNINGTGAKPLYLNNTVSSDTNYTLPAGVYLCRYNGTNYYIDKGYFVTNARNSNLATMADYSRQGAYCTTSAGTPAKVANMRGYTLRSGATFPITFTNSNTSASELTLNVNDTGAKTLYINNSVSSASNYTLDSGTYLCRYNGTNYYIDRGYFVTTSRTVGGYGVNNQAISTQNDSLNALVTIAKKYANATSGTSSVKSGYIQLGNGFKIQWGRTATNTSMETINLTLPFTSVNSYVVFATREKTTEFSSGGGADKSPQFYKVSASQFKLDCPSGSEVRSVWVAIGY